MKNFINPSARTGNVVFNFRRDPIGDLVPFALGYHHAARALTGRFKGNAYAEYDGYPVLFLYRHSLELYLKAIVYRGARLLSLMNDQEYQQPQKLFRNHGLVRLLPSVREIFKAMNWNFETTQIGSFEEFESVVKAIESIDNESFAFRYPMDPTGAAIMDHHLIVNVWMFAEIMNDVLGYLYGVAYLLDEQFQSTAQARYELQCLMAEHEE